MRMDARGGEIPAPRSRGASARPAYSAVVVSSASDLIRLTKTVPWLWTRETARPGFFLASLSPDQWTPCVVIVRRGPAVVGLVYAKQRRLAGLATGLVFADGSLVPLVVAVPGAHEAVVAVALQALFASAGVRGVRLVIPPHGPEQRAVTAACAAMALEVTYTSVATHARLLLPDSYQKFLHDLGASTRRNFRRYRSRFEATGHHYLAHLSPDEFRQAVGELRTKSRIPLARRAVERGVNLMAAVERPVAVALRCRSGEWLSVAGGWYEDSRATLFVQLNQDRAFADLALSGVLRGYLIETLIHQGIRELVFWAGTGPPLARYAACVPALGVHLDRPTRGWRMLCAVLARLSAWLPDYIAAEIAWITPARSRSA